MKVEIPDAPIRVFKPAVGQWYPAYQIGTGNHVSHEAAVKVSFLNLTDGSWRVCCWGADDFGLERDFPGHQKAEAWAIFVQLISAKEISEKKLRDLGFVNA